MTQEAPNWKTYDRVAHQAAAHLLCLMFVVFCRRFTFHTKFWRALFSLGINNPSDSVAVGNAPLVVFSYRVNSQSVASLASLGTEGTLVAEPADVGLHVLLHCVPELAAIVTLSALPDGFPKHRVIRRDHQLGNLPVQLRLIFIVALDQSSLMA